jgi:hypothetical protein
MELLDHWAASQASSTSTISPISQSRSVAFAAIAGVVRSPDAHFSEDDDICW